MILPFARSARLLLASVMVLAGLGTAHAQSVPQELLDNSRRMQGDTITFCLDPTSAGAELDRRVAQAVADALLLNANFADAPSGFALDGAGYMEELQITMSNRCDVLMGVSLQTGGIFPDWVVFTRPYAQVPFVLAVTDTDYQRLGDIPTDAVIGTALGSRGEREFLIFNTQLPENQQWRRLPYADPDLMLTRLEDGSLAGMLIWQPALLGLTDGDPAARGLTIIPTDPVPASHVSVGALVSSRDAFLRSQMDEAIGALVVDGTIEAILADLGYGGTAGS